MPLSRRSFLFGLAGAGVAGLAAGRLGSSPSGGLRRVERRGRAFGTTVALTALHEDEAVAARALDGAFAALERVEEAMSLYRPASGLCRLNRDGALPAPDPWLVEVLERAQGWARASDGAFDPTVQPLWHAWATARAQGRLPTEAELAAGLDLVGWRDLEVSLDRVVLRRAGMAVTLNGIAQGFALDRAAAALRAEGVAHALLDTGELGALGAREGGVAWTAGVQHPRRADAWVALARLEGRCLATSGDYATTFTPDRAHHHVLDPARGDSPQELAGVTVAAPSGVDADALSTAVLVLGRERGTALVAATPGADALFVAKDGRVWSTPGFPEA